MPSAAMRGKWSVWLYSFGNVVPAARTGSRRGGRLDPFDLNGGLSGKQDRSVDGQFLHETIQGTYSITRDCALQFTANVYDDSGTLLRTSVIDGLVVDNGKQIRAHCESETPDIKGDNFIRIAADLRHRPTPHFGGNLNSVLLFTALGKSRR